MANNKIFGPEEIVQATEGFNSFAVTDDISQDFIKNVQDKELSKFLEETNSISLAQEQEKEKSQTKKEDLTIYDRMYGQDTFLSNVSEKTLSFQQGTAAASFGVVLGVKDALEETLDAINDLGWWLNDNVLDLEINPNTILNSFTGGIEKPSERTEDIKLPNFPKENVLRQEVEKSIAGNISKNIAQFTATFIPVLKALKVINGGKKLVKTKEAVKVIVASGGAQALAFDPLEERVSNLIQSFPMLANPIAEYLAANPNDTQANGRWKNFLEGSLLGLVGEGAVFVLSKGINAIKANRARLGETNGFQKDTVQDFVPAIRTENGTIIQGNKGELHVDIIKRQIDEAIPVPDLEGIRIEDIVPAIRTADGEVHLGTPDIGHDELAASVGLEEGVVAERGFVTKDGKYITPEELDVLMDNQVKIDGALLKRERALEEAFDKVDDEKRSGFVNTVTGEFSSKAQAAKKLAIKEEEVGKSADTTLGDEGVELGALDLRNRQTAADKPVPTPIGDPEEGFIPKNIEEAYKNGEINVIGIINNINWSNIRNGNNIEEAVKRINNVVNKELPKNATQEDMLKYGLKHGLSNEILLARGQLSSSVLTEELIINSSLKNLIKLSNIAKTSLNELDLHAVYQAVNIHRAITNKVGIVSASIKEGKAAVNIDAALNKTKVNAKTKAEQFNKIQQQLVEAGGARQIRSLADAISKSTPENVNKVLKGSLGKRIFDMILEWRYFSLLSKPRTHVLNFMGTGANALWQIPVRQLAAGYSKLLNTPNGIQVEEASIMFRTMLNSFEDALQAAGRTIKTGETKTNIARFDHTPQKAITADNLGLPLQPNGKLIHDMGFKFGKAIDFLGSVIRSPSERGLASGDEFWATVANITANRLEAYRAAKFTGKTGKDLIEHEQKLLNSPHSLEWEENVEKFRKYITFTSDLEPFGQSMQSFINRHPVMKFFIPFFKTPANILKQAQDNTPLALLSRRFLNDVRSGGPERDLALARVTTGSFLLASFSSLVFAGMVTGAGPTNPELRKTWELSHKPFSIKVPLGIPGLIKAGEWIQYNRLDPFGTFLGAAAGYAEIFANGDAQNLEELMAAISVATSNVLVNKTWAQGPAETLEILFNPDPNGKNVERWIQKNLGSLLIPGIVDTFRQHNDPVWRQVYSMTDAIKARIPGYSKDLPPVRNIWGQAIISMTLGPSILSPLYKYQQPEFPIDNYLWENRIGIEMPNRVQMGVELDPKEYDEFVRLQGNELKVIDGMGLYDLLNATMAGKSSLSVQWGLATDGPEGGRALLIKNQISAYRQAAINKMYAENETFRNKVNLAKQKKIENLLGIPLQ